MIINFDFCKYCRDFIIDIFFSVVIMSYRSREEKRREEKIRRMMEEKIGDTEKRKRTLYRMDLKALAGVKCERCHSIVTVTGTHVARPWECRVVKLNCHCTEGHQFEAKDEAAVAKNEGADVKSRSKSMENEKAVEVDLKTDTLGWHEFQDANGKLLMEFGKMNLK